MKLVSFLVDGQAHYVNPKYVTSVKEDNGRTAIDVVGLHYTLSVNELIQDVVRKIQDALPS